MKRIVAIAVLGVGLGLSACSSDDPGLLPGDDADQILSNLERVAQLATDGACDSALESIDTISSQIDALPSSVSSKLRQNLKRGVVRLQEVTAASCGSEAETDVETDTTSELPETVPSNEPDTGGTTGGTGTTGPGGGSNGGDRGDKGGAGGDGGNRGGGGSGGNTGGDGGSGGGAGKPKPDNGGGGGNTTPPDNGNSDSGGISPSVPAQPGSEEVP